jgi:hypothetical protein
MLSALVRIQVKNDQGAPIVPVIKTKKPRKQREKKKKVHQSEEDDTLDYSKFVPLKIKNDVPLSYEEDDGDDGSFAAVVKGDDDDEFEDENDIYTKQDLEWAELMKEATVSMDEDDSDSSSVLGDSSPSVSQNHTDVEDSLSEMSIEGSPYHDDDIGEDADDGIFYGKDDDSFFSHVRKEKEKPIKKYTGIVITEDDDFIP